MSPRSRTTSSSTTTRGTIAKALQLPRRVWRGRLSRLITRTLITAAVCWLTGTFIPGTDAAPVIQAAVVAWWIVTLPPELAPSKTPGEGPGNRTEEDK